jgi:geranylgeranyl reductase family protein
MRITSERRVDVIVVGAGPAGAAAAYDLAEAGLHTLLLDRRAFPRIKPCGGALTIKALNRLRFSIAPLIRFVARDLHVSFKSGRGKVYGSRHPVAVMTVRSELDDFCLRKAIERGAAFELVDDIAEVGEDEHGVLVRTGAGNLYQASFLVGADGANSRVRRLLGATPVTRALALEGHVPVSRARSAPRMRLDLAAVGGGYGWAFPKGDHLNVGLFTQQDGVTFSKSDLVDYARRTFGAEVVENMAGYPLGIGGEEFVQTWQRIFLVGDAAGGAERLLGEGIHNAIKSGQTAAAAIIATARKGVSAAAFFLEHMNEVKKDLSACSVVARWIYRSQRLGYTTVGLLPARATLMRGFAAGKTLREILRTSILSPLYPIRPVRDVVEYETGLRQAGSG